MVKERLYWDSSCFISYLSATHPDEIRRAEICKDILKHAQNDDVEIWTSVWSIVETVRPREQHQPPPLPQWSILLNAINKDGSLQFPKALKQLEQLWEYFDRHSSHSRRISVQEAEEIERIFDYPFIKKIQVEPTIAKHAAKISRDRNIKPADALHVASALARQCVKLQRWDRDFERSDDLIPSEDPAMISPQAALPLSVGDFQLTASNEETNDEEEPRQPIQTAPVDPAPFRGINDGSAQGEGAGEAQIKTAQETKAEEKPKAASDDCLGKESEVTGSKNTPAPGSVIGPSGPSARSDK